MKKAIAILISLLFEITVINAQGLDTDSLQNLLSKSKEDTTRILVLSLLCNELARYDPDTAIRLAQDGLKLAKQIHFQKGEVYLAGALGVACANVGDYFNSIKWLSSNLKYADTTKDLYIKGVYYGELTVAYREQGDYAEALRLSDKIISLLRNLPQDSCMFCRAVFAVRANIYLEENLLDSAKTYIDKAFSYPPTPRKAINASALDVAGRIQTSIKNYDSALQLYRQSVLAFQELRQIYRGLPKVYQSMAILLNTIGRKDSALFYLHESLAISQSKNFAKEILEAHLALGKIYETYNTDSALYYYKQAMNARDVLYNQDKQRQISNYKFNLELEQQQAENAQVQFRSRIKIYALLALALTFLTLGVILWRNTVRKKRSYVLLQKQKAETDYQKEKAEQTLEELKATQAQLIQSEKMASLGELTAGIAHEIQNPLNFVNNFSDVNKELLVEMKDEMQRGNIGDANSIAKDVIANEEKINQHGKRAEAIVKGMLQHSRSSSGVKEPTDINALADEYLRLAYHGLHAKDKTFNATTKTDFDENIGKINVVPQDIGRVLVNLLNNAFYAVSLLPPSGGGFRDPNYKHEPTVLVSTKKINDKVLISIRDNGPGIPQKVRDKIFQPFFTTKPTGQGTGLGLSLAYDIVKAHGGEITVESTEGKGSQFSILLPAKINE